MKNMHLKNRQLLRGEELSLWSAFYSGRKGRGGKNKKVVKGDTQRFFTKLMKK